MNNAVSSKEPYQSQLLKRKQSDGKIKAPADGVPQEVNCSLLLFSSYRDLTLEILLEGKQTLSIMPCPNITIMLLSQQG